MQNKFFAVKFDGMPRVIAALVADDDVAISREDINDLAFSLIAPLGADQNTVHAYNFTTLTSRIGGNFLISATTFSGTSLSVLITVRASIFLLLRTRPSDISAILILLLPRIVPTVPTTPGWSSF